MKEVSGSTSEGDLSGLGYYGVSLVSGIQVEQAVVEDQCAFSPGILSLQGETDMEAEMF